jgi:hypothetical protein
MYVLLNYQNWAVVGILNIQNENVNTISANKVVILCSILTPWNRVLEKLTGL